MKPVAAMAALACGAWAAWYWWPAQGGVAPAAGPAVPVHQAAVPARDGGLSQWQDAQVEPPPPEPVRVPLPPVDTVSPAWMSMAEAREHGDPRTPPMAHDAPSAHVQPTPEQLADPQAYHRFQQGQHARLLASFADAAREEVPRLRADMERGRAAGVPEAELAKMKEKIKRIEALREGTEADATK